MSCLVLHRGLLLLLVGIRGVIRAGEKWKEAAEDNRGAGMLGSSTRMSCMVHGVDLKGAAWLGIDLEGSSMVENIVINRRNNSKLCRICSYDLILISDWPSLFFVSKKN